MENKSGIITPLNLLSACLIMAGAGQWLLYTRAGALFGFLLFLAAVILFIIADKKSAAFKPQTITLKTEIITAAFITAAAVFFRFFNIDKMPPGCFVDEGYIGLDIIDVLNGALPIYIGVPTDNPAVFLYFGAAMFKFFGAGIEQLRLVSAVVGTLTFISFYFLLRYMLGQKTALFGAFIFAVMKWHVWFSRMGLHDIFSFIFIFLYILRQGRIKKTDGLLHNGRLLACFLLQYTRRAPFAF